MTLNELQDLKRELTRHDYRYYILNQPIISDQAYDILYKEYEKALIDAIGMDTRSLETADEYPVWILFEFDGIKPLA